MLNKISPFFKKNFTNFLCLVVLLSIAWTSTNFLAPNTPKLGADDRFPLAPTAKLGEYLNIWSHRVRMLGGPIPMRIATIFPSTLLLSLLENLHLPIWVWEQVEYFLLYSMGLFGTFYFSWYLSKSKIVSLSAAVFFITNPLSLNMLNVARDGMYLWTGYPFMLALFIRGFHKKRILGPALIFAFGSLLTSPGAANPPTLVVVFISLFIFFIYFYFFSESPRKKGIFLYGFLCVFFYSLVNLWWILPSTSSYSDYVNDFVGTYDPVAYARDASTHTSLFSLMRLSKRGDFPPLQSGFYGFHYLAIYDLVTFLPTILVMAALLLSRGKSRIVPFYTFFTLVFLFLAKGSHLPFRFIYEWMLRHFPGFSMFRTPADKFGLFVLLGYSFLIGMAVKELILKVRQIADNNLKSFFILFCLTPLVLLFREGLNQPYEFKYGNILVTTFVFLVFNFLFSKIFSLKRKQKKYLIAETFFYLFFLVLLDAKLFTSPLVNFGVLKILLITFSAGVFSFFTKKISSFSYKSLWPYLFAIGIIPFVFTNAINHINGTIKLSVSGAMIPSYYFQAKDWLKSFTDDFRLLSLPSNAVVVAYLWPGGGFGGYDFVPEFFERPTVDFLAGDNFTEPIRFQSLKVFGGVSLRKIFPDIVSTKNIAKVLKLMNINYLMVHNDFWWEYYGTDDPKKVKDDISKQKGINFEKTFGALDFYKINEPLPYIYGSPEAVLVSGKTTSLTTLTEGDYLDKNPVLIISEQQSSSQLNDFYKIGGKILFENSTYSDLALDYLSERYGIFTSFPGKITDVDIGYQGVYEIWSKADKLTESGDIEIFLNEKGKIVPERTIEINSYIHDLTKSRWIKVDEFFLEKGKYNFLAPELIISARLGKIVLVPRVLREKEQQYLSQLVDKRELNPEFYFSPKNYLFSSQKDLFEIEPSINREFYISSKQEKQYLLEGSLELKKVLAKNKNLFSFPKFILKPSDDFTNFKDWKISSQGVDYQVESFSPLRLIAKFEKDSSSPEIINIENSEEVDLTKYPYLALTYFVQDNRVQNLSLRISVDIDDDGNSDFQYEFNKEDGFQSKNTAVFNALDLVEKKVPDKKSYRVIKSEVIAEKKAGINCSRQKKDYEFALDYLSWLRERPPSPFVPLVGISLNRDTGVYRYISHQRKEDFVGYVYQPSENFGFVPISLDNKSYGSNSVFSFEEKEGYPLSLDENLSIAFPKEDFSGGNPISVEVLIRKSDGEKLLFREQYKLEKVKVRELLWENSSFKATESGILEEGIIILWRNLLKDISFGSGLRLLDLKLGVDSDNMFDYLPFQIVVGSMDEVPFSDKENSLEVKINKRTINLPEEEKLETDDNLQVKSLVDLDEGFNNFQVNYEGSSYLPKFFNLKIPADNKKTAPVIKYKRLSFSKYQIDIDSSEGFWLVFSESFNKGWRAYLRKENIIDKTFFGKLVLGNIFSNKEQIKNHFLVNGYANGWFIDKSGKSQIILEYRPQISFEIGVLISILFILVVVMYIGVKRIRKKKK